MLVFKQSSLQITYGCKVVICDNHPQMRRGLRNVLMDMLGCEVVAETAFGEEALELVESHHPDLLILDLSLAGDLNGRNVLSEIRRKRLQVKVFIHTAFLNRTDFDEWIDDSDGPDGIEEKSTGDRELAIGLTQVLITREKYIPLRLIKRFAIRQQGTALDRLTAKEMQAFRLALRPEFSTQGIADKMNCAPSTVRSYLATIYAKLGLEQRTRPALMMFYYDHRDEILP